MYTTPDASKRVTVKDMIQDLLADDYEHLSLMHLRVDEDTLSAQTLINYKIKHNNSIIEVNEAAGNGATDAFFKSILKYFNHLKSIKSMQLKSFDVKADLLKSTIGTDAKVFVNTQFCNGIQCANFSHSDFSIITACCKCMLKAIEYFLNCELAFKKMKLIIEDAKARNRSDIVSAFEYKIAMLVNSNISTYREVQ